MLAAPYPIGTKPENNVNRLVEQHHTNSIEVVLFIGHEVSAKDVLKYTDIAMPWAKEEDLNRTPSGSLPLGACHPDRHRACTP